MNRMVVALTRNIDPALSDLELLKKLGTPRNIVPRHSKALMQPAVQLQKRGMRLQGIAVEIKEKAWILPPGSALRLSNVDIF